MRRRPKSKIRRRTQKNEEENDFVIREEVGRNDDLKRNFFAIDNCSLSSLSQQRESVCSTDRDIVQNIALINNNWGN